MNTVLTISNIQPSVYIKVLFSFLLVASFLASCTTDNPASSTNNDDTLTDIDSIPPTFDCPDTTANVAITIPINGSPLTLTDTLTGLTVTDETDTEAPTIIYDPATVTVDNTSVTATATDEAGNDAICTFAIIVTQEMLSTTLTATSFTGCEADGTSILSLTLSSTATSTTLTDAITDITSSDTGGETPTNTYMPASVTLDTPSVSVIVTARDANNDIAQTSDSNPATCTFTVMVTPAIIDCPTASSDVTITDNIASWAPPTAANGTILAAPTFASSEPTTQATGASDSPHTATFPQSLTDTTYTVTYSGVTDSFSNADTCSFMVTIPAFTIPDESAPVFTDCVSGAGAFTISYPRGLTTFVFDASTTPSLDATDPETGISTITYDPPMTNISSSPVTVEATATNGAIPALTATCTFTITFDEITVVGSELFVRADPDEDVSATNPFLIVTESDLSNLAAQVNAGTTPYPTAHYRLVTSINLPNPVAGQTSNFTPIGQITVTTTNAFMGTFDGNSNTISNLQYTNAMNSELIALGLFGAINGNAAISNLTLTNSMISNSNSPATTLGTGALVGNVLSSNNLISKVAVLDGTVVGLASRVGGLVGENYGKIMNSAATITVTGPDAVGGLVGQLETSGEIVASFASGAVAGTDEGVGGLVGLSTLSQDSRGARIYNSYATGTVTSSGFSASNVGGLIGSGPAINILNSYARGMVTCTGAGCGTTVRGLEGSGFAAGISNSYWDITGTGIAADNSLDTDSYGEGLTPTALMPTDFTDDFSAWDDDPITGTTIAGGQWRFAANMYPGLADNAVPLDQQPRTATTQ